MRLNFDGAISSRLEVAQGVGAKLDAVEPRHGVAERRKGAPNLPIAPLVHGDLPSPAVANRRTAFWLARGERRVEQTGVVQARVVASLCTIKRCESQLRRAIREQHAKISNHLLVEGR